MDNRSSHAECGWNQLQLFVAVCPVFLFFHVVNIWFKVFKLFLALTKEHVTTYCAHTLVTYIVVLYHVLNVLDSKTFLKHLIRQKNTATQVDDFKLLSDRRLRNT